MEPYPFQPHTFGRMLPYVDSDQSVALFEEFRAVGLIDERGFGQMPQYYEHDRWYVVQLLSFAALLGIALLLAGKSRSNTVAARLCLSGPERR